MNRAPLVLTLPPELSDEAAAQLLDFLYELTVAFEKHYADQLRRYYERPSPPDAEPCDDFEDDDLPDF